MIARRAPSGSGRARSRSSPSSPASGWPTSTASAARASPGPIAAAASAPVAPSSSCSVAPSGSVTVIAISAVQAILRRQAAGTPLRVAAAVQWRALQRRAQEGLHRLDVELRAGASDQLLARRLVIEARAVGAGAGPP